MLQSIFILFLSAAAIAGTAVIWRNWLVDHPWWKTAITRTLGIFQKVLLCGSCFTYWLALSFTIAARPLEWWYPFGYSFMAEILGIFSQWMALSWTSVFLRFLYVSLQEYVHHQVHHGDHAH
jgi:hypothetical protein